MVKSITEESMFMLLVGGAFREVFLKTTLENVENLEFLGFSNINLN
jgi:hypothetical protein